MTNRQIEKPENEGPGVSARRSKTKDLERSKFLGKFRLPTYRLLRKNRPNAMETLLKQERPRKS
jgi:hypothetical protein